MSIESTLMVDEFFGESKEAMECGVEFISVVKRSAKDLRTNLDGLLLATIALAEICDDKKDPLEEHELQIKSEFYQINLKRIGVPKKLSH